MNVVIYARFSSHSQTEQSIEGQLKVCYEYAESHNYTVVGEYIDRAQSGKFDNRADFQRMIADSDKHTFEGVLVYQLDRFARNRYDSAIYKAKLKKNGVRVLSAKENITDDASGILIEGVLESMAEYYSVELAQKIHRGMSINAEKCLSNGSNPGLGFKVNKKDRTFYVDEEEAAIVREIYERYASGETKAEIVKDLQRRRVKTSLGNEFTYNSLSRLLKNKRYIGIYLYKGVETPGGMPRILDDDLFYRVQALMNKNKSAPARTRGENEYLLTTKLFCGHCKEMMVGYGGTGKSGKQYHYYMCKKARKKKCNKKIISKDYIEDRVVSECLKMLTDEKIRYIAKKVAEECNKSPDNISVREIKKAIKEVDTAIENLWKGIEQGQAVDMLTERLHQRQVEKEELETQLAIENNKKICLSEAQILAFLDYVCEMPLDDFNKRRAIINIFVHSIYLYDDHFTLIINASKKPLSIENIPLDDIEEAFEGENTETEGCSSMMTPAPAGGVKMGWQTVLRAENIWGPYELKTVLMQGSTGINGPHQGAWVQTQTGEDWFIHFQDCYAAGRVVHLQPMMWKADGWPVIGHPVGGEEWGEPVPVCKKPDVGASYPPCAPDATDYFESGTLGLQWQWNANPKDGWAMFETGTRGLWMRAAALDPTLGKREQKLCHLPNLLLQKWPVPAFTCITTCDMSGLKPGDEAGVVSMGTYYCAVCAVCEEQHTSLWLVTGGRKDEMAEKRKKLLEAISDTLFVKYEVRPNGVHLRAQTKNAPLERITLSYSTDGTHYEQVHSEDSLQGFWVGIKSGVYALHRGPGEEGRMRVQSVVYEAESGLE